MASAINMKWSHLLILGIFYTTSIRCADLTCGGSFKFSKESLEYTIVSPGYPNEAYPGVTYTGVQCTWTFESFDYHDVYVTINEALFRGVVKPDCSSSDRLQFTTPANPAFRILCDRDQIIAPLDKPKFSIQFYRTFSDLPQPSDTTAYGFSIVLTAKPYYDLQCDIGGFSMKLPFSKLDIKERYPYENYQLLDSSCRATISSTFLSLSSGYEDCGTSTVSGSSDYSNVIVMVAKEAGDVAQRPTRRLPVTCKYLAPDHVISSSYDVFRSRISTRKQFTIKTMKRKVPVPNLRPIRIPGGITIITETSTFEGEFNLEVMINVYDNDEFHVNGQPNLWEPNLLYFDVIAPRAPAKWMVAARTCWITTTSDYGDQNQYLFMKDGCPVTNDPIEQHPSANNSDRFSFGSIELPGAPSKYHIHCNVAVCRSPGPFDLCDKTCRAPAAPVTAIAPQTAGYIVGVVKDAVARNELAEVQVTVTQGSRVIGQTKTTTEGTYNLILPESTGYVVSFTANRYHPATMQNINITSEQDTVLETLLYIDETITGPGRVGGIVTNAYTGNCEELVDVSFREGINNFSGSFYQAVRTGVDGTWQAMLETGHYTAELSKNGFSNTHLTITALGGETMGNQNAAISPVVAFGETRVILRWGETPLDLDSHMTGPNGGKRFHVYFNKKGSNSSRPYTNLDVDDRDGYGPETITIVQQVDGMYRYSVHDFSNQEVGGGSSALADSNAQVQVLRGSTVLKTYNVPNLPGTLWTVFELNANSLTQINTMSKRYSAEAVGAPADLVRLTK